MTGPPPSAPSPWDLPASPWAAKSRDRSWPESTEVVVIGGGLAGCAAAAALAEGGARVVVLDEDVDIGLGYSGRCSGVAWPGHSDNPARLARALGPDKARAYLRFSYRSVRTLTETGTAMATGGWVAATDPAEAAELEASAALLAVEGVQLTVPEGGSLADAFDGRRLLGGYVDAAALSLHPQAEIRRFAARAAHRGATILCGTTVHAVQAQEDLIVHTDAGSIRAEAVIYAAGHRSPIVEPFLADKLFPVRHQQIALDSPRLPSALLAQRGFIEMAPGPAGDGVIMGGCRWATPHLEAGESDRTAGVPAVDRKIDTVIRPLLPSTVDAPVTHRWSAIMTFTCDGLPIVGPIPGRPRQLVCTGWGGRPWACAPAAAAALAAGLLTGRPGDLPPWLGPDRFV